jgi:hypothetical protein
VLPFWQKLMIVSKPALVSSGKLRPDHREVMVMIGDGDGDGDGEGNGDGDGEGNGDGDDDD